MSKSIFFSSIKFEWMQIHLNVLNYIKRGNLYLSQYVKQIIEPYFLLIQIHFKIIESEFSLLSF